MMPLDWITPEEGRKNTWDKLYLPYQPGYPLMVACINLPVETRWDQIDRKLGLNSEEA